jgi:hypothetical protein
MGICFGCVLRCARRVRDLRTRRDHLDRSGRDGVKIQTCINARRQCQIDLTRHPEHSITAGEIA